MEASVHHTDTEDIAKTSKGVKIKIGRCDIKHFSGKKLVDAAKELGVSPSTLKRRCRDMGIERWTSQKKYKAGCIWTNPQLGNRILDVDGEVTQEPEKGHDKDITTGKGTDQTYNMIVKATYRDDVVKFHLDSNSGFNELVKALNKRFGLISTKFKIKYEDKDDGDWIMIACDEDLHFHVKALISAGKTGMNLKIFPQTMYDSLLDGGRLENGEDPVLIDLPRSPALVNNEKVCHFTSALREINNVVEESLENPNGSQTGPSNIFPAMKKHPSQTAPVISTMGEPKQRHNQHSSEQQMSQNLKTTYHNESDINKGLQVDMKNHQTLNGKLCDNVTWKLPSFSCEAQKVIDYAFGKGDDNEILADIHVEIARRTSLESLKPMRWLFSEVINIQVAILTLEQHMRYPMGDYHVWFLPHYFMGFCLGPFTKEKGFHQNMLKTFFEHNRYGGEFRYCEKVFIPMNDNNEHWYLCMVDLKERRVLILDSLEGRYNRIKPYVEAVINVLHNIFVAIFSKEYQDDITGFPIQVPLWVPKQSNGFDCGMYLIKYMKMYDDIKEGMLVDINDSNSSFERQRMLLDIICHMKNTARDKLFRDLGIRNQTFEKFSVEVSLRDTKNYVYLDVSQRDRTLSEELGNGTEHQFQLSQQPPSLDDNVQDPQTADDNENFKGVEIEIDSDRFEQCSGKREADVAKELGGISAMGEKKQRHNWHSKEQQLLRRRCAKDSVFTPYFPADEPQKFAIVHKVFGAGNVNKILQDLPEQQRGDAVSSMVYEANARVRDPVYGCVGAILSLQQQIDALQTQLAFAQAEVVHMRLRQFSSVSGNTTANSLDNNNLSPSSRQTPSHHHDRSLFTMGMIIDHQGNLGETLWGNLGESLWSY